MASYPASGRIRPWLVALILGGGAAGASDVAAQRDTTRPVTLETITVSTAREQAPAPAVATIVAAEAELQRTRAANPYDLIRRALGIEIHEQGQGPGFASDAVVRGFTSDHSSDVLLVLDGVPLNLPIHGHVEGYADWNLIAPLSLQAVRLIHGPASPLYGDFAFGGVVEAVTAPDAAGTIALVGGSSHGDAEASFRTGSRRERSGLMLAGTGRRDRGWRENADYWLGTTLLRGWQQAGSARLEGGIGVYASGWNSPGFVSVARYNRDDLEAAADRTDGGDAWRLFGHGNLTWPLGTEARLETTGWAQAARSTVFLNIPHDGLLAQSDEEDERLAAGGQAQLVWRRGAREITLGVAGRADATTYDLFASDDRQRDEPTARYDGRYYNGAVYGRWRSLVTDRLALDLGGRVDHLIYRSRDRLVQGPVWRDGMATVISPKLGARYILSGRAALLASVSRGFRGAPGVIGDPGRDPVIAWAKELGAEYDATAFRIHLSLFRFDVSRERIQDPVTREISAEGTSRRQGASVEVTARLGPALHLEAQGTFNDAVITGAAPAPSGRVLDLAIAPGPHRPLFHDEPLTPGARVPGVARYQGRVTLRAAPSGPYETGVTLRYSGPFTPIGEPDVRTRPYVVLDAGGSIRLPRLRGTLSLELQNLLGTRYPEIRASGFINPGAPRTLRVAWRLGGTD